MRKRNYRMRRIVADEGALNHVLHDTRPTHPDDVVQIMYTLRLAYEKLKAGHGTPDDVHLLGWMLNVGFARAQDIGQPLVQAFEDGGAAMQECEALQARHGRYGFTGPGLLKMNAALDLYGELLAMSSPNQMTAAENKAEKWLRDAANAQAITT